MKAWNFYPVNQIKPHGWLKHQLQLQANGLAGNLDRVWPDVRDSAWIGGDREGWERVPYWLDGFIPLAYLLENEDMIARAQKYIDAILSRQQEDGWICPCKKEERAQYDPWGILLISKVLTVAYQCSADQRIITALYRMMKNYYNLLKDGTCKLFSWGAFRWFEGMISIDFLYQRYQEEWLPEMAGILKKQGTDYDTLIPLWKRPLNCWRAETHLVNIVMMLKQEAVYCDLLGEEYTDHAQELYQILKDYNGTCVETFTGDECLAGLSPIQGTELCAVVEQMYSYELLYAYTGDNKWAERLEKIAFNALPAAISDDMWSHQYDQMSNQIACIQFPQPGKPIFRTNNADSHLFGLEPGYGCCTANHSQGWPKLAMATFLHQGNTILNALPIASELKTGQTRILLETNYPFAHQLHYTIETSQEFTLQVRIPSFARNVTVNGKAAPAGDLKVPVYVGSTELTVEFTVQPCLVDRPYDLKSAELGSLVFSIPIQYEKKQYEYEKNGVERKFPYCDYEYIPLSDWDYAYCGQPCYDGTSTVSDVAFSSENPPISLTIPACRIDWQPEDGYETVCSKIPQSRVPTSQAQEIKLIPYGCAKLRMTEIPLINNDSAREN